MESLREKYAVFNVVKSPKIIDKIQQNIDFE